MVDYSTAAWIKIILALVIAFVISFIATPLVKNFAVKVGAIDIPDKKRHIHSHPIPRMGGLAIFIGFLISVLLFANITTQVRGILVGAILIAVVGEHYLAIILPGQSFFKSFDKLGLKRKFLTRILNDAGAAVNAIIPWSVSGVFIAGALQVNPLRFIPWTFFS